MQTSFQSFYTEQSLQVVNVASVPQLSPFRYPGGKTWLIPFVLNWLRSLPLRPHLFIDPFLGGGSVPLSVASHSLANRCILREIDDEVAAVWECIFGGDHERLCQKILAFRISRDAVRRELLKEDSGPAERAFRTIVKNRTHRGGILAKGASLMNAGENGRGVTSRWYPATLVKRIRSIAQLKDFIEFECADGLQTIREHVRDPRAVFFIDPPYTAGNGKRAGTRLYRHNQLNHEELFELMSECAGFFLMTYDDDAAVAALAKRFCFNTVRIPMKNTHHEEKCELAITNI